MKPKILQVTEKGDLILPKDLLDMLGVTEESELEITLKEGEIQVRPLPKLPISDDLETDPALRRRVLAAIERSQRGEVLDEEESQEFLRNPENFGNPPSDDPPSS